MDIQRMRQFVKNSNIEVESNNNNDNALAANIEAAMAPQPHEGAENLNKFLKNETVGNFAEFYRVNNSGFYVSDLKPGMFNVTVNRNFDSATRVDLGALLKKPILPAAPLTKGISIEVLEIKGIYGRFQTGFRKDTQGSQGSQTRKDFFSVDYKARIFNDKGSKGVSFTIYKNGKIRFSGGFLGLEKVTEQPNLIRTYMIDNYTDRSSFLYGNAFYNNISGQFKVNAKFKSISSLPMRGQRYGLEPTTSYEAEIAAPILYVDYQGYNFNMSENGVVQILGLDEPENLVAAYKVGSELMRKFKRGGEFIVQDIKKSPKRRRLKVKKTTCPKTRVPPCKAGYAAKKNPQGFDCCYKIPKKSSTNNAQPQKRFVVAFDNKQRLKINGLQCARYPKPELVKIAREMGIVGIKEKTTVKELCSLISSVRRINPVVNSIKVGSKQMSVNGQGNKFRLSKRMCKTYKKADLIKIVEGLRLRRTGKETVPVLCSMIERYKPANSLRNKVISAYGSAWMNKYRNVMGPINGDVKMLRNKIGQTNVKNVDNLIKKTVAALKKSRKASLDKKLLKSNGVGKNNNGTPKATKRSGNKASGSRKK
jgi:hypothetical protein